MRARDAAEVVFYRGTPGAREVLWVRRGQDNGWAAGFYGLPRGRVEAGDASAPLNIVQDDSALLSAALRGLFEQTGILLASGPLEAAKLETGRKALLERRARFGDFLSMHGVQGDGAALVPAGRWVTPTAFPNRLDTRLFVVPAPAGLSDPTPDGSQALEAKWITVAEALLLWVEGKALLHPQLLHALEVLRGPAVGESLLTGLAAPPFAPGGAPVRIEFQKGVRVFPMLTPTLPPAAHTNAYVLGTGELLIVDPGSPTGRERARLFAFIEALRSEGKRVKAIVLTHHHEDHVLGAVAARDRLKTPIWGHVLTAERVKFSLDRALNDGDIIELAGVLPMRWKVLHTPGHAKGHLVLREEQSGALIAGDMIAGVGTVLIDPPEGDMTDYIAQLRRLETLDLHALYPSHGPPLPEGPGKLADLIRHREARERQVLDALQGPALLLAEVTRKAYSELPEEMMPIAQRSTQAILLKLMREGKAVRKDDKWVKAEG